LANSIHPPSSLFTAITPISTLFSHFTSSYFATVTPTQILYGFQQTIIDSKGDWEQQKGGFYGMQLLLWLYKEDNKLRDWKNIFTRPHPELHTLIPPLQDPS
jgi:hypothetical protein